MAKKIEIPSELYQCIVLRNEGYSMQVFAKKYLYI